MVGFSSETDVYDGETADESLTTISFMPRVGYFVIDGLGIYAAPMFENSSYGDASQSMFAFFVAPVYAFDLKSTVFPFIGAMVGYNSMNIDNGNTDQTYSGLSYGGMGGIAVVLGKNALMNVALGYRMITANPEDWEGDRIGSNQFDIEVGFSVFFGGK
jgi:hypothetical protein